MKWSKKHPSKTKILNPGLAEIKHAENKNLLRHTNYEDLNAFQQALSNINGAFAKLVDGIESIATGKKNPIDAIYFNAVAIQAPASYLEAFVEIKYPDNVALQEQTQKLMKSVRSAMKTIDDAYDFRHLSNRNVLTIKAYKAFKEELVTPLREFYNKQGMAKPLCDLDNRIKAVNLVIQNSSTMNIN